MNHKNLSLIPLLFLIQQVLTLSTSEKAIVLWNKLVGRHPLNSSTSHGIKLKYKGIERSCAIKEDTKNNNK